MTNDQNPNDQILLLIKINLEIDHWGLGFS